MNKQELIDILKWQVEAGVEETFGDFAPLTSLKKKKEGETPSKANNMAEAKTAANDVASNANNYAPVELPESSSKQKEKSSFQNFMENKTPSYEAKDGELKESEEHIKEAQKLADGAKTLEDLKKAIDSFEGLSIKKLAKNTVFGEGHSESDLMLIGEAPGQNEDEEGRPFCGVSGRLLDKIFKFGGYTRDGKKSDNSFYITNTVFWRPPGNRKPLPEELAMCRPFVEKHIALVNPKVIVLVGGTATESVLGLKDSVTRLRKGSHKYYSKHLDKEIECFAIYHPSFLLRQPTQKKNAWADMLKIKKFIENL